MRPLPLICFGYALLAFFVGIQSREVQGEENVLLHALLTEGIQLPEGQGTAKLPPPVLRDGMTAEAQRAAIEKVAGDTDMERLLKKSVVSPFILEIEATTDLPDQGHVQQVDLMFVAHGSLKDIENKKLFEDLATPKKKEKSGPPEEARELTAEELAPRKLVAGEQPDGSKVGYGMMQANILDKVYLTGITYSRGSRSEESLSTAFRLDPTLIDDVKFPGRWFPLLEDDVGNAKLGDSHAYAAAGAYARATTLKFVDDALFVEIHIVFAEPHGWFQGRNLLRSKLPPLLQDTVRTFRRKLAQ